MPRRDGTGPMGIGPRTGRQMGFCNAAKVVGTIGGLGLGLGLGFRRGFGWSEESLAQQKALLEDRLTSINDQLNNLKDKN